MNKFYILSLIHITTSCETPSVDSIFVLDGTANVGESNFSKMKSFVKSFVDKMDIGIEDSRIGVMQFTPTARPEFYPLNYLKNDLVKNAVNDIPFNPCLGTKTQC